MHQMQNVTKVKKLEFSINMINITNGVLKIICDIFDTGTNYAEGYRSENNSLLQFLH